MSWESQGVCEQGRGRFHIGCKRLSVAVRGGWEVGKEARVMVQAGEDEVCA